ncbi:CAP domain-containing protein [Streptomyces sp. HMX112]|uniref:CAP domain-containing protein n=1 Tax=Streptomyces sp. HMX112 TaxID=3390850 RepID=UPI003A813BAA
MGRHRRSGGKKRATVPVRTGLLGASAAMAVGAVAVASGLLPGGDTFKLGGGTSEERIHAGGGASELRTHGGASATPTVRPSAAPPPASRSAEAPKAPAKRSSPAPAKPSSAAPKPSEAPAPAKSRSAAPSRTATAPHPKAPEKVADKPTDRATASSQPPAATGTGTGTGAADTGREEAAEAAVLGLVNAERAKAGCSPVQASRSLAALAGAFSADMARRDFFSHTDPDGDSPWDRAEQAGVKDLGGENIARGQADARAVMESWMNSDGHRANILNCDYTRLGVGVHFGDGGPWWTQNFGF